MDDLINKLFDAVYNENEDLDLKMIGLNKDMINWLVGLCENRPMISRYHGIGIFAAEGSYDAMGFDDYINDLEYSLISKTNLIEILSNAWALEKRDFQGDIQDITNMSFNKILHAKSESWGKTISHIIKLNDDYCSLEIYTGWPYEKMKGKYVS